MNKARIDFKDIKWERVSEGADHKIYSEGNSRIRLIRFRETFKEEEWCTNGHVGYVLRGEMKIDFNGNIKNYKEGDGLWINEGVFNKHKLIMERGKEVELILFESVK